MSKGKRSLFVALSAFALTLLNGVFGLIVTKLIITTYGSDFNGLNSTATQFVSMLMIIEGGFTLATNVALFKPLANNNQKEINQILSATKLIFRRLSLLFFIIGVISAIAYSFLIKSNLAWEIIISTLLMTIVSTTFTLWYTTKYAILLKSEQKDYILNIINIGTVLLSQSLIIVFILLEEHMLLVRFITMVGTIITGLIVGIYTKRNYRFITFNSTPRYEAIKGTKDVFIQKLTSMVYGAMPIIVISASVGTLHASLYAIYNNVFILLKTMIYAFINAPSMGLGKLIAEKENNYVFKIFTIYEHIVNNILLTILTTATVLVLPFIKIYTLGVNDIEYVNWKIALLFVFITFFEIIHIPSGHIINMSGRFKVAKKIQMTSFIILVILMTIGNVLFSLYGILIAVMLTAILLALLEIGYVHKVYFKSFKTNYFKLLIPGILLSALLIYIETILLPPIQSYIGFFLIGTLLIVINAISFITFNLLIHKEITLEVIKRIRRIR